MPLKVTSGISAPYVTNIPQNWDREWFRSFINHFLALADTRNSISSPNAQVTGNINVPATIQTIGGVPPIFLDDGGGGDGDGLIVPGPAGTSVFNVVAFRTSNSTSTSTTIQADSQLFLTFSNTGNYAFEIYLPVYNSNGNAGFQFDLNSVTATLTNLVYSVVGFNNCATSATAVWKIPSISSNSLNPSWLLIKGFVTVTGAGTWGLRWAQFNLDAVNATVLTTGAYMMATKIG
jgi:hypothetical protein